MRYDALRALNRTQSAGVIEADAMTGAIAAPERKLYLISNPAHRPGIPGHDFVRRQSSTPKASVISASPMRSKSAETSISPRRKPRRRAWPDSGLSTATTLAMGRPALAMMNGSPRADLLEQLREPGLGFMNIDGFHERFARLAGLTKLGLLSSSQASSHRYRTPKPCGQSGTPARIRRCRFCLTVQQKQQHMLIKQKHNANFLAAIHEIRKL